jgi:hypothetical protein
LKEDFFVSKNLKAHLFYNSSFELDSIAKGEGKTLTINDEKIAA